MVTGLIDQVLARHPGVKWFHIGGDEVKFNCCLYKKAKSCNGISTCYMYKNVNHELSCSKSIYVQLFAVHVGNNAVTINIFGIPLTTLDWRNNKP